MIKNSFSFLFVGAIIILTSLGFSSCNNNDDNNTYQRGYWYLYLNAQSQVPAVNRSETGNVAMLLMSDNTLRYSIKVDNLASGDELTDAHLHVGDPLTNGGIILNFHPTFSSSGTASGSLVLRQSLVDSLVNTNNQIYVNVHSIQYPDGLIRGQVNSDVLFAADVDLTGANQVPPVVTTATGKALIRLTTERKLYSNVSVTNLESGDALTMAHIHLGAAGTNGNIFITLCSTIADFGINKITTLTNDQISSLKTASTYVNAHSTAHPDGVVRGQLVNGIVNPPTNPNPNPY